MIYRKKRIYLFLKGAFQDPNSILHPLYEILYFDLEGSQTLGPFGQNLFHFPPPVKNGLDFLLGHFLVHFLLHLFGPGRFIHSWSHGDLLPGFLCPPCRGEREYFRAPSHTFWTPGPKGVFNLPKSDFSGKGKVPGKVPCPFRRVGHSARPHIQKDLSYAKKQHKIIKVSCRHPSKALARVQKPSPASSTLIPTGGFLNEA